MHPGKWGEKKASKEILFSKFSEFFLVEMETPHQRALGNVSPVFRCLDLAHPRLARLVVPRRKPQSLTEGPRCFGTLLEGEAWEGRELSGTWKAQSARIWGLGSPQLRSGSGQPQSMCRHSPGHGPAPRGTHVSQQRRAGLRGDTQGAGWPLGLHPTTLPLPARDAAGARLHKGIAFPSSSQLFWLSPRVYSFASASITRKKGWKEEGHATSWN